MEQEAIGRRIKRQRLNLGMPQADLGAAVGKKQDWGSKVKSRTTELDSAGLINQIAAALHCHLNTCWSGRTSKAPTRTNAGRSRVHRHRWVRCPALRIGPARRLQLEKIRNNLTDWITERTATVTVNPKRSRDVADKSPDRGTMQ
ncbi:hypothetical protein ACFWOJ_31440 [Streptomyces sp. NPDC058439]|uniref:hypothetical protein n=1 Tax=Streptomyces sp. NPDC058439 TaxID=3346500 RepID=UPI0036506275